MGIKRVSLDEEPIDGAATVLHYDRYAASFMRPEYLLTVRDIRRRGFTGGKVLDIGTGSGRLAIELSKVKQNGYYMVGLDISATMLKQALAYSGKPKSSRPINYIQATSAQLPFPDGTFDVVTSYASLHHWKDPVQVFKEIWRVTRNGGLILIRDNRRMLDHPFYKAVIWIMTRFMKKHQRRMWPRSIMASYTVDEVKQLLRQTGMRNSRVKSDMAGFDLCIEAKKTR